MSVLAVAQDVKIETRQTRFGKWVYVIHLKQDKSQPSRKFGSQHEAMADARELVSYMR